MASLGYSIKKKKGTTYTAVGNGGASNGDKEHTFTMEADNDLIFYIKNSQRLLSFDRRIIIDPQ